MKIVGQRAAVCVLLKTTWAWAFTIQKEQIYVSRQALTPGIPLFRVGNPRD